jgi:hypothetical protein
MLACTWSGFKKAGPRLPPNAHEAAHEDLYGTAHVTAHENAREMRLPWIFELCRNR